MRGTSRVHNRVPNREPEGHYGAEETQRRAVGYVRVSTDMQAKEGLSLEAQQSAIESYCALHGIKLVCVYQDVISGGKDVRPGLQAALSTLLSSADIFVVLKFDRLSRSIKHFCELYETYFKDGTRELVAIRESIRMDSSLGRALVGILLVFAQMEREATGERTREAINHIRKSGYHFGKAPYGKRAIPAPNDPRRKLLIDDDAELAVLAQIEEWSAAGVGISKIADRLNTLQATPPQGGQWTKSTIYNLKVRQNIVSPRPHNQRPYDDSEVRAHILELRAHDHYPRQIASILNEQGWIPLKGRQFTAPSVRRLLAGSNPASVLTPKRYLDLMMTKMERIHRKAHPREHFLRPGFPTLARMLEEAGYKTPKGCANWWPAQVQQLWDGNFEKYYEGR